MSKFQRVYFKNGTGPIDIPQEKPYDELKLRSTEGILLWEQNDTKIPHDNVLAIVAMEVEETKPEETT